MWRNITLTLERQAYSPFFQIYPFGCITWFLLSSKYPLKRLLVRQLEWKSNLFKDVFVIGISEYSLEMIAKEDISNVSGKYNRAFFFHKYIADGILSEFRDLYLKNLAGRRSFIVQKTLLSEERNDYKYHCFDDASPEHDINESSERDAPFDFEELPQIVQHAHKYEEYGPYQRF